MATVASWHGHEFGIQPGKITGFRDLHVTSEAETEEQEQGDDTWLKWKKYKPKKISITCEYVAALGADPWTEAENMIRDLGYTDYFYLGGYKLLPEKVMLTKAEMYDAVIGANTRYWEKVLVDCVFEVAEAGALNWGTRGAQSSTVSAAAASGSGSTKTYSATVYYSTGSGATSSVSATSTVSQKDAEKKAYAKVPKNAQWASTTKSQATNQQKVETKKAAQNVVSQAVKKIKTNALAKLGLVKK